MPVTVTVTQVSIAPVSGVDNSFLSKAALTASAIWSLDREANITVVFLRVSGTWDRAASAFKQIGARNLGFQKSGSSVPAVHDRHTIQTKPFFL